MKDQERFIALLGDFGVTPSLSVWHAPGDAPLEMVSLYAQEGTDGNYLGLCCSFAFDVVDGSFAGIWGPE